MKQEVPTAQHTPASAIRARASRAKDSSGLDSTSPGSKSRPRASPADAGSRLSRVRRAILPNKEKLGEEREAEEVKSVDRPRSRATEQYVRVRRYGEANRRSSEYEDDLQRRLSVSESMVKELQSEVSDLRLQLERLEGCNALLESHNKQLGRDLSSAEAKIQALEKRDQKQMQISKEVQRSEFKDIRELISTKLDIFPAKTTKMLPLALEQGIRSAGIQPSVQLTMPPPSRAAPVPGLPPPPPPPPPPRRAPPRTHTVQKAPALVEFYHSITKREVSKAHLGSEKCSSPVASNAHNSIVDELQNRSSHLLAIKADVEKKRDFINHLIQKVQSAAFADIEDVPAFADWLDGQLSTLADERAVLKHFSWPEKKADALREAAFEYRDLKRLLAEVSSFEDEISLPCEATLKKATTLLDKSERSIQRLIRLRGTTMVSYRDYKIPVEWMLDTGIVCQIKLASTKLAKVYLRRVSTELESVRHTERESLQEALLLQGVRFAYRAYQFAGGLDAETMRAFEELRERSQLHRGGSKDLLHAVTVP